MPVVFDSSGPVREMFECFASQVIISTKVTVLTVLLIMKDKAGIAR